MKDEDECRKTRCCITVHPHHFYIHILTNP